MLILRKLWLNDFEISLLVNLSNLKLQNEVLFVFINLDIVKFYMYTIIESSFHISMNKSANALALCHPPSASFCSVLAVQWSSRIFTHDRYNIPSDILIEFEVNLGIIIEKYA